MKNTFHLILFALAGTMFSCHADKQIITKVAAYPSTFCNPVNVNYRFMKINEAPGVREAADPVVTYFKGKYYLFASKSSGYWSSTDFVNWKHTFISDEVMPIEDYAPGTFVYNDSVYFVGSTHGKAMLYRSADPESGRWDKVKEIWSHWDPSFYVEGDELFMYYGCSPIDPIFHKVLDLKTLEEKSKQIACLNSDVKNHGWERPGEKNELPRRPYIEGSWMTKHNGLYYLQYATPGTEWKTYADGVYVSSSPSGPFTYAVNNPVSYKPTGFLGGAGHGCLFKVGENYWKVATNSISVRHMFERRVSLYPAGFDDTDALYTDTYLGDYPMYLPSVEKRKKTRPDWMLLSLKKKVTASSVQDGKVENIVDDDARTTWAAKSNSEAEWVVIDLAHESTIRAIQVNYAEYGAKQLGFQAGTYQSYVLSASHDGEHWSVIADKANKRTDTPHDYIEFQIPFEARYIKWENKGYSVSEHVSLRDIRVFGKTEGAKPEKVSRFECKRNSSDPCKMVVSWEPVKDAVGYIIREGVNEKNLFHNYQVMDSTRYEMTGLNAEAEYYLAIDAFNESGITQGEVHKVSK